MKTQVLATFFCLIAVINAQKKPDEENGLFVRSSLRLHAGENGVVPYPVGIPLDLSCIFPAEEPAWHEHDIKLKDQKVEDEGAIMKKTTYHISSLRATDNLRNLTCIAGEPSAPQSVSVVLHVIDRLGPVQVFEIRSLSSPTNISFGCKEMDLDESLQLCWYQGEEELHCREDQFETTSSSIGFLMLKNIADLCDATLTCRVTRKAGQDLLTEEASKLLNDKLLPVRSEPLVVDCERVSGPYLKDLKDTGPSDAEMTKSEDKDGSITFSPMSFFTFALVLLAVNWRP